MEVYVVGAGGEKGDNLVVVAEEGNGQAVGGVIVPGILARASHLLSCFRRRRGR
jgi:hypothetical protein